MAVEDIEETCDRLAIERDRLHRELALDWFFDNQEHLSQLKTKKELNNKEQKK